MIYTLKCENFELCLEPFFFVKDFNLSVNTSVGIHIVSDGFSADANMDVGRKELARFAADLIQLYHRLSGAAALKEPYGLHNRIEFLAQKGGHILVQGCLSKVCPGTAGQELRFSNLFDQTYLQTFVCELRDLV